MFKSAKTFVSYQANYDMILVISARPQRETNAKGCRISGDLDQLESKDTIYAKNGKMIPTVKRGKEIKQQ